MSALASRKRQGRTCSSSERDGGIPMKVFYRKAYGCFVCTDVYHRPWWWSFRHHLPHRVNSASFFIPCLASAGMAFVLSAFF